MKLGTYEVISKRRLRVKLSLYTPRRCTGGTEVYLHPFLASAIYGSVVKSDAPPVSFQVMALKYSLQKSLFGHERRSRGFGEEDRLAAAQFEPRIVQPPVYSQHSTSFLDSLQSVGCKNYLLTRDFVHVNYNFY
jgi:hypothetical protein